MKFRWGIVAVITVLFLFGGLYFIGMVKSSADKGLENNTSIVNAEYALASGNKMSIKQIDSLSAAYNFSFTSVNAKVTSLKSIYR